MLLQLPGTQDSGLSVAASSFSLLGRVLSPRLTPSPFSGVTHTAHTLPAFLTFTARRDIRCLGLYLVLEPLTPSTSPGLFQQSSCVVLGKPPSWAPRLLRAELLALRVGRADLPLWVELGPPGHSRATRRAATLLTLSLGCRRNQRTD